MIMEYVTSVTIMPKIKSTVLEILASAACLII